MMHKKTLQITTGGAIVAIFALILLLNRQTGGIFQEMMVYILPIPMVAYSAKFGWKSGVPVLIAMCLISLIFGTITTIWYAVSEAFIGLVFGSCINRKADMTKTMFLVMFLSAAATLLDMVVLASLFGNDLSLVISQTRESVMNAFDKYISINTSLTAEQLQQLALAKARFTEDYIRRMYIVVVLMFGALQGYLVYAISLLLLNRLRVNVPKPRPVFTYYPPQVTGWLAAAFFCIYYLGLWQYVQGTFGNVLQTAGIVAQLYLSIFGALAVALLFRIYVPGHRLLGSIAAIVLFFIMPLVEIVLGVMYIDRKRHDFWLERAQRAEEALRQA